MAQLEASEKKRALEKTPPSNNSLTPSAQIEKELDEEFKVFFNNIVKANKKNIATIKELTDFSHYSEMIEEITGVGWVLHKIQLS